MELFSYHLIQAPFYSVAARLFSSSALRRVEGLRHAECLMPMTLGRAVALPTRYHPRHLVLFARWESEAHLERFLAAPPYRVLARDHWHIRMRFYRRWGHYKELDDAHEYSELANPAGRVVGITFARLQVTQAIRFARWGKPVEEQVRDQPGMERAVVAYRPLTTFSTFSIWKSEADMLNMVRGREGGASHREAMKERVRKDFHYEFTTMRLVPLSEHGTWPVRLLPAAH